MDDNKRLKELLKISPEDMDEDQEKEFLKELENANLFLAVDLDSDFSDFTMEDLKIELDDNNHFEFSPIVARQEDGTTFLPLFTDVEAAEEFHQSSFITIGCSEAALIILQTEGVNAVVINPGSEHSIGIPVKSFLEFVRDFNIKKFEKGVIEYAKPLKTESRFYLRENVPLMRDTAEDGIFTSESLFNASFKDNFSDDYKYLNILIVPRGIRFLYVGEEGEFGDSMFPPVIKFKLIKEEGNIFTWECIYQDSAVKSKSNHYIYLFIIVIIVIVAIISFLVI